VELLIKALVSVFPEADASKITLETKLADIPGWDSMNAVNVLAQLEALTGRENLQLAFSNSLTISQILEALRAQGVEG
jgi:acyl carrier protein